MTKVASHAQARLLSEGRCNLDLIEACRAVLASPHLIAAMLNRRSRHFAGVIGRWLEQPCWACGNRQGRL